MATTVAASRARRKKQKGIPGSGTETQDDVPDSPSLKSRKLTGLSYMRQTFRGAEFDVAISFVRRFRRLRSTSCFCLRVTNPLRKFALKVVSNKWFDRFIIIAILVNCFFLALYDPLDSNNASWRNIIVEQSELYFTVIFTLEMLFKVVALGFVGKASYLSDGWNWIDFLVVIVGYVALIPSVDSVSALRTFRVLRPLRTLTSVPGMRVIVKSMLSSIPALFSVFLLCMFIFFVYGILGLQLWTGVLQGHCTLTDEFCALPCPDNTTTCVATFGDECPPVIMTDEGQLVPYSEEAEQFMRSDQEVLPQECVRKSNPAFGVVSFDNIGAASLSIFTSITLEGWTDIMYSLNKTWGLPPATAIYFISLIMIGAFFLLNLALAVIWGEYNKAEKQVEMEAAEIEAEEAWLKQGQNGEGKANGDITVIPVEEPEPVASPEKPRNGDAVVDDKTPEKRQDHRNLTASAPILLTKPSVDSLHKSGIRHIPVATSNSRRTSAIIREEIPPSPPLNPDPGSTHDSPRPPLKEEYPETKKRKVEGKDQNDQLSESDPKNVPPLQPKRSDLMLLASKKPIPWQWCCRCYRKHVTRPLNRLVIHRAFTTTITISILLNTAALAAEHYAMSETFQNILETSNLFLTCVFTLEMILKLMGLGIKEYMRSKFNIFDGIIVLISLVEIVLSNTGGGGSKSGLSALRSFRLMRIFKLARSWTDLRRLLATIAKSVADVANASVVLLIIMFIFSLLGMQLFGGRFPSPLPRAHFDTLWWSFVTVFQILTGENWNQVLYETFAAVGPLAIIYFVLLNLIGNYLILNLFLAILLGNFEASEEEEDKIMGEEPTESNSVDKGCEGEEQVTFAPSPRRSSDDSSLEHKKKPSSDLTNQPMEVESKWATQELNTQEDVEAQEVSLISRAGKPSRVVPIDDAAVDVGTKPKATPGRQMSEAPNSVKKRCSRLTSRDRSMGCFSLENRFRKAARSIVKHKAFELTILVFIGLSSIMLALDEPWVENCKDLPESDPDNCVLFADILFYSDMALTICFIVEMMLKIIAHGFTLNKGAYLRSGWNILDFMIVLISTLSLVFAEAASQLKALRSLRALRALRPLRVVSRYPGLKLVVNSIFGALPKVQSVALVNALFFLIFGIIGVQNWRGALNACNDPSITNPEQCVGEFQPVGELCEYYPTPEETLRCKLWPATSEPFPREWGPKSYNFNNIGNALLLVFEVASGEMWPDIMYDTVDATGSDSSPERDNNQLAALYFIAVNVVCAFFMLEIFTGVIIDNYNTIKAETNGSALLTSEQQLWVDNMKNVLMTRPNRIMKPPKGGRESWRYRIWQTARSSWFDWFIMTIILLNTLSMASLHFNQDAEWEQLLELLNYIFTGIFTVEAMLKMVGFGLKQYFSVGWNRFDFILVVLSLSSMAVPGGNIATLFRVFRVARVIRLLRGFKSVMQLIKTLVVSAPSLANVGAILSLVYFIFALVAMNVFGTVKEGEFLNEDANFSGFFISMLTLFRVSTGESYNGIMYDCMVQPPYCDPDINCGSPVLAPLFFVFFYLLTAFILLNLLVAIILSNFGDSEDHDQSGTFVFNDDVKQAFVKEWSKYDPDATKLISPVCNHLAVGKNIADASPDRVPMTMTRRKYGRALLAKWKLPDHGGKLHFNDLLEAAVKEAFGTEVTLPQEIQITQQISQAKLRVKRRAKESGFTLREVIAAEMLQSLFKSHRARKIVQTWRQTAREALKASRTARDTDGESKEFSPHTLQENPANHMKLGMPPIRKMSEQKTISSGSENSSDGSPQPPPQENAEVITPR